MTIRRKESPNLCNINTLRSERDVLSTLDDLQGEAEWILVFRKNVLRARKRRKRLALLRHNQLKIRHVDALNNVEALAW